MGLDLPYTEGQTPLDDDEKEGLLISTITTRSELDEFEQLNIEEAIQWSIGRNFTLENLFTESFVRALHQRMYGKVWAWAGEFRKTNKNIGVDKWQIPTALKLLLDDVKYWHIHQTYPPDEITLRFKHRLVSIHCFPNGNGRHSRLIADIIIEKIFKLPVYTWGSGQFNNQVAQRTSYLQAMRDADAGDILPLIAFARS